MQRKLLCCSAACRNQVCQAARGAGSQQRQPAALQLQEQ
jgi:hypothetical protein